MKQENVDNIIDNPSRLAWACRRGMLELDVLLEKFLTKSYPGLSIEDKRLFVEFLQSNDPELFAWIMGHETPSDERFRRMSEMIRANAQSRL